MKSTPISISNFYLVQELLGKGFSYKEIARESGVSTATISCIKRGKHRLCKISLDGIREPPPMEDGRTEELSLWYRRCPGCGSKSVLSPGKQLNGDQILECWACYINGLLGPIRNGRDVTP